MNELFEWIKQALCLKLHNPIIRSEFHELIILFFLLCTTKLITVFLSFFLGKSVVVFYIKFPLRECVALFDQVIKPVALKCALAVMLINMAFNIRLYRYLCICTWMAESIVIHLIWMRIIVYIACLRVNIFGLISCCLCNMQSMHRKFSATWQRVTMVSYQFRSMCEASVTANFFYIVRLPSNFGEILSIKFMRWIMKFKT